MQCKQLIIADDTNVFATEILRSMERRQAKLFDNPAFSAAIYMDPRFNFSDSTVLTSEQKKNSLGNFKITNKISPISKSYCIFSISGSNFQDLATYEAVFTIGTIS
jgi:hypothetical protein